MATDLKTGIRLPTARTIFHPNIHRDSYSISVKDPNFATKQSIHETLLSLSCACGLSKGRFFAGDIFFKRRSF
jgi:hypothetical protein